MPQYVIQDGALARVMSGPLVPAGAVEIQIGDLPAGSLAADALRWSAEYPHVDPWYDLAARSRVQIDEINVAAGEVRAVFVSKGRLQAPEYEMSGREAEAYLAKYPDESPSEPPGADTVNWPMLTATLGRDGETLRAVALTLLGIKRAWAAVLAAVKTRRIAATDAIAAQLDGIDDPATAAASITRARWSAMQAITASAKADLPVVAQAAYAAATS